jgi:hypothetical protein
MTWFLLIVLEETAGEITRFLKIARLISGALKANPRLTIATGVNCLLASYPILMASLS